MNRSVERVAVEAASTDALRVRPRLPVFTSGEGCWLYDTSGVRFFDLTGGSGAVNLGHQHPRVVSAAAAQLRRLIHTGWNIPTDTRAELVGKLGEFSPYAECGVLFTVSGTEAVEAALKVARAHTGRRLVVTFERGYHGKSAGSLAVTWRERFKKFSVLPEGGVVTAPYPLLHSGDARVGPEACLRRLRSILEEATAAGEPPAALILEPLQASEGMLPAGRYFLERVLALRQEFGCLVVFDEIYTGFGRCGTPFYCNKLDALPDLLVIGKALGNGIPGSAVIGPPGVLDSLPHGIHTSTFAANPLACAVGCAVIDEMTETLLWEQAARKGARLTAFLERLSAEFPFVSAPRGEGLMLGFDCLGSEGEPSKAAEAFAEAALAERLVLRHGGFGGCTIKLTPPLTMTDEEEEFLYAALRKAAEAIR